VVEGKENFYDDYTCGVAVPVTGSIGCATFIVSSGGAVLTLIIAAIEVATAVDAGAEVAMMGTLAVATVAATVAFLVLPTWLLLVARWCVCGEEFIYLMASVRITDEL
jgi:hypothetical protein